MSTRMPTHTSLLQLEYALLYEYGQSSEILGETTTLKVPFLELNILHGVLGIKRVSGVGQNERNSARSHPDCSAPLL
jgi:hypothetical protein